MRKKFSIPINNILLSILIISISTGCMKTGMKKGNHKMGSMMSRFSETVQTTNTGQAIDQMIEETVTDLLKQKLDINYIAVWRIRSQTAGIDVEMIRQKLITQLNSLNHFKVVTRERLTELLEEQSLSLSGTIDEKSAVEIGDLIGVEGFVDGYASIEDDYFMLNLSGIIIWAKTIDRTISPFL